MQWRVVNLPVERKKFPVSTLPRLSRLHFTEIVQSPLYRDCPVSTLPRLSRLHFTEVDDTLHNRGENLGFQYFGGHIFTQLFTIVQPGENKYYRWALIYKWKLNLKIIVQKCFFPYPLHRLLHRRQET